MSAIPRLLMGPLPDAGELLPDIRTPGRWRSTDAVKIFTTQARNPDRYDLPYQFSPQAISELWKNLPPGWEPDALIWCDGTYHPIPEDILDCPCPTAVVPLEINLHYYQSLETAGFFDHVISHRHFLPLLEAAGHASLFWSPYSFDATQHFPEPHTLRDWDLGFIGNLGTHTLYPKRRQLLRELLNLSQNFRIRIVSGLYGEDYRRALNRSKIVFNATAHGEMNLRAYEAAACGALLMIEADNHEISAFLKPGEECVTYTPETLQEQVIHYLNHPAEREAIAQAGQRRIQDFAPSAQFEALQRLVPAIQDSWRRGRGRQVRQLSAFEHRKRQLNQLRACRFGQSEAQKLYQHVQVQAWRGEHAHTLLSRWEQGLEAEQQQQAQAAAALYQEALAGTRQAERWQREYAAHYDNTDVLLLAPQLCAHNSDFYYAWQRLGYSVAAAERPEACLRLFQTHLCVSLGRLALKRSQGAQARDFFEQALTLTPTLTEIRLLLGHLQLEAGELTQAFHTYAQALETDPFVPDFWSQLAQLDPLLLPQDREAWEKLEQLVQIGHQLGASAYLSQSCSQALHSLSQLCQIALQLQERRFTPASLQPLLALNPPLQRYVQLFGLLSQAPWVHARYPRLAAPVRVLRSSGADPLPELPPDSGFLPHTAQATHPTLYLGASSAPPSWPYLFAAGDSLAVPAELRERVHWLGLISPTVTSPDNLAGLQACLANSPAETGILLWQPTKSLTENQLATLETALGAADQNRLLILDAESEDVNALAILQRLQLCLITPAPELAWFFWACLHQGVPVTLTGDWPQELPRGGLTAEQLSSLSQVSLETALSPVYAQQTQALQSLVQHYQQEEALALWLQLLWELRLAESTGSLV